MTFEEFFKKKRIDLAALEIGEPALFSEFKTHFEQMGEKSFDHTKKYWFNKTRRKFPLAPEVKTEKPHIANPVAEQTVTDTPAPAPVAKMGFVPKFKAANTAKSPVAPGNKTEEAANPPVSENPVIESIATPASPPKIGFVPRFKAGTTPKPAAADNEIKKEVSPEPISETPAEEKPAETTAPKPAYKPRFNSKTMPPKPPEE